jgi:hypothetical protein
VNGPDWQREAIRQQQLLRALWRRGDDRSVALWVRDSAARSVQALAAYRGNAAAIAARALATTYPTVSQLVGDESFEQLARALWHRQPPRQGDLATFGAELAVFIEGDAQLASEPYLADVARLDWAVHVLERAEDAPAQPAGLQRLATDDAATLRLVLRPGAALIRSRWPVATIWQAHRSSAPDRFDGVRAALQAGRGEAAWVWRDGWHAAVDAVDELQARFIEHVLAGDSIDAALAAAGDGFSFEQWLRDALARQWLGAVSGVDDSHGIGDSR